VAERVALITGITGQDGSYLAELLLSQGYRVAGITRRAAGELPATIRHLADRIELLSGDIRDQRTIEAALAVALPHEIYHLAAETVVQRSWVDPVGSADSTALGTARLLEEVVRIVPTARVFVAGSSEMFGQPVESPQNETTPFHPLSPYGAAKLYAYWLAAAYRQRHSLFVATGILFNHESPRRPIEFVTRKVADGAARIALGLETQLRLGDLESRRDWGHAADYVQAMFGMLQIDRPEDFVIGTGETHSVRELCEIAFAAVGLDYREHVVQDERFLRKVDAPALVADATKARTRLGWTPRVSFQHLVHEMVGADLVRLGKKTDASPNHVTERDAASH
jgi:GDPmannose 4,6-dehydratase